MVEIGWLTGRWGVASAIGVVSAVALMIASHHWNSRSVGDARTAFRLDAASIGIEFGAARRTLILAIQQDCPACTASMAFYRQLTDRATSDVRVVVAAPRENVQINEYLSTHGVEPDVVVHQASDTLPVSVTPTLLLVDAAGFVEHFWVGVLSSDAEEDLLTGLFGGSP